MNRSLMSARLAKIIGNRNVTRLQAMLKYVLSFRHVYHWREDVPKTVIFMIDGRTPHGGLSDRLRGLFATYMYCKERGYKFKVNWVYPFKLQDYLQPASFDWTIEPEDITHNKKYVAFRFFNSYSRMNNDEKGYYAILNTKKPVEHVYSNVTMHEERYAQLFKELFVLAEPLQLSVKQCLTQIGGGISQ